MAYLKFSAPSAFCQRNASKQEPAAAAAATIRYWNKTKKKLSISIRPPKRSILGWLEMFALWLLVSLYHHPVPYSHACSSLLTEQGLACCQCLPRQSVSTACCMYIFVYVGMHACMCMYIFLYVATRRDLFNVLLQTDTDIQTADQCHKNVLPAYYCTCVSGHIWNIDQTPHTGFLTNKMRAYAQKLKTKEFRSRQCHWLS